MQTFSFLSALPALLGLAGFVLYQVLGANKGGDDISKRIVEKLRKEKSGEVPLDQRLTPKQVERLLEQQQRLRSEVGEHDFQLLKQALTQQFVVTVFVYVLTLGFCSWSVYLFVQSPLKNAGPVPTEQTSQKQISFGNSSPNVISNRSGPVTDRASTTQTSQSQTSSGNNSPNVISNGSGAVTVTIQDQTKVTSGSKVEDKKK